VNIAELRFRPVAAGDLPAPATFRCSAGEPWEDVVEAQIGHAAAMPKRSAVCRATATAM
jgi:hypothetical protein